MQTHCALRLDLKNSVSTEAAVEIPYKTFQLCNKSAKDLAVFVIFEKQPSKLILTCRINLSPGVSYQRFSRDTINSLKIDDLTIENPQIRTYFLVNNIDQSNDLSNKKEIKLCASSQTLLVFA